MLEDTPTGQEPTSESAPAEAPVKKAAAKKAPAKKAAAKKTTSRSAAKKTAAPTEPPAESLAESPAEPPAGDLEVPAKKAPAKRSAAKKTAAKKTTARKTAAKKVAETAGTSETSETAETAETSAAAGAGQVPLFQAPEPVEQPAARKSAAKKTTRPAKKAAAPAEEPAAGAPVEAPAETPGDVADDASQGEQDRSETTSDDDNGEGGSSSGRRRRRRGGRRRRKSGGGGEDSSEGSDDDSDDDGAGADGDGTAKADTAAKSDKKDRQGNGSREQKSDGDQASPEDGDDDKDQQGEGGSSSTRRRRRRRRAGEDGGDGQDDPKNTVTRVRQGRTSEDQIQSVTGSTRLEAKKQRRREGREAGRRRAPIVSEAEFLARRESVDRVMAIRQRDDLTQIAVLEDKVLVEHYVARESQTSLIGNVYLGRVQNVLPSMEAAFIDIGKGRNAVLYAGEVNWSALGHQEGQPRKIESVLSSGQTILVQVTKDPVGHKGARLTSQISLAGRFLVYVPDGTNSGISRKLPDTERNRLKSLLKEIVPDGAGVIVRTAAEGASEDELTRDVERLKARWEDIEKGAKKSSGGAQLLYGEPDLMLKVVRDLFTEDFSRLVVQGDDAWETVRNYVDHVAPDLAERLEQHPAENDGTATDLFATWRIDEQIHKGLDRKVWLPSGGSLVIDRTEAMTVVDVNTGKFTGSGGNLEETVTKNNLEAAEEIVRQLRLRDIGGIIVVDFIDMVLESNRDLVLRRLVECLGRDRTKHQVAEVTSLGLVQMTRKRIGTGLLEAFSETCEHCQGRGVVIADTPVEPKREQEPKRARRSRGGKGRDQSNGQDDQAKQDDKHDKSPSPKDVAAMARPHQEEKPADEKPADEQPADEKPAETEQTVAQTAAPEQPEPEATPEPEAVPEAEAEAVPEPEAAAPEPERSPEPPAAPKVVTRTRRRSASRPAGPPASASEPAAASEALSGSLSGSPSGSGTPEQPVGAPGVVGAPPADGAVEPGTADAESGPKPVVEHVPVKKRGGARKR
jgi:ribonuclease E